MKPIVEEVALEHKDTFIIGLLDIDDNRQTTEEYKVNGIPAYIIFQNGAEAARIVGVETESDICTENPRRTGVDIHAGIS